MSLTKIDTVYLYTSGTNSTKKELAVKQMLDDAGIKYTELNYHDANQIPDVLKALNTWTWNAEQVFRNFIAFPIVTWREHYDNLHEINFNVTSTEELKKSSLIKNNKLVA